jgi:hypothetical protein
MSTPTTPTAFPLQWPHGWPKTSPGAHQGSLFKTDTPRALNNLKRQLSLMGAKDIILSSNYTLGMENPKDPGVCAYFQWSGLQLAIPCDRWRRICDNIQAIALTVEAMRGMERWGAKEMIRAMFTGFKALPAGEPEEAWWKVLGVAHNAGAKEIRDAYVALAKKHHPDHGGSHEVFVKIVQALDTARSNGFLE